MDDLLPEMRQEVAIFLYVFDSNAFSKETAVRVPQLEGKENDKLHNEVTMTLWPPYLSYYTSETGDVLYWLNPSFKKMVNGLRNKLDPQ